VGTLAVSFPPVEISFKLTEAALPGSGQSMPQQEKASRNRLGGIDCVDFELRSSRPEDGDCSLMVSS